MPKNYKFESGWVRGKEGGKGMMQGVA